MNGKNLWLLSFTADAQHFSYESESTNLMKFIWKFMFEILNRSQIWIFQTCLSQNKEICSTNFLSITYFASRHLFDIVFDERNYSSVKIQVDRCWPTSFLREYFNKEQINWNITTIWQTDDKHRWLIQYPT